MAEVTRCPNPQCIDGEIIENQRFIACPVCHGTGIVLPETSQGGQPS